MGFEDEFDAADDADGSLLAAALACLSHPEATVIRLHDGSGLSFEEIGETIGLDAPSARAAWARGLKDLARLCNGHHGGAAYRGLDPFCSPSCETLPGDGS